MIDLLLKNIFTYLDIYNYSTLIKVDKQFNKVIKCRTFINNIVKYVNYEINKLTIINEEEDSRDDCGSNGWLLYLNNGAIIDSLEYDDYKYRLYIHLKNHFDIFLDHIQLMKWLNFHNNENIINYMKKN